MNTTSSNGQARKEANTTASTTLLTLHEQEVYKSKVYHVRQAKQRRVTLVEDTSELQKRYNNTARQLELGSTRLGELDKEKQSIQANVNVIRGLVQSGTTQLDEWKDKDMALLLGNTKAQLQTWVYRQKEKERQSGIQRGPYQVLLNLLVNEDMEALRLFHAHNVNADDIDALIQCIPRLQVFGLLSLDDTEHAAFISYLDVTVKPFLVAKMASYRRPNLALPSYPLTTWDQVLIEMQTTPGTPLKRAAATSESAFSQFSYSSSSSDSSKTNKASKMEHDIEERYLFMDEIPGSDEYEARIAALTRECSHENDQCNKLRTELGQLRSEYNRIKDRLQVQQTSITDCTAEITRLQNEYESLKTAYAPVKGGLRQLYEGCRLRDDSLDMGNVLAAIRDCLVIYLDSLYSQEVSSISDWAKKSFAARVVTIKRSRLFDKTKLMVDVNVLEKFAKVTISPIANRNYFSHFVPKDKIDFAVDTLFDRYALSWLPQNAKREIRELVLYNNRMLRLKNVDLGWTSARRLDIGIGSFTPQQGDTNAQEDNAEDDAGSDDGSWTTIEKKY
jgi:predicted nuclease with TOPRIM domain